MKNTTKQTPKLDHEAMLISLCNQQWADVEGLSFEEGLERGSCIFVSNDDIDCLVSKCLIEPIYETTESEEAQSLELYDELYGDIYNPDFDPYDRGIEDWEDVA